MYQTKLKAIITEKESKKPSVFEIMNMRYSVTDNTLWITDHRGHLIDFDLNKNEVEIVHVDKKCNPIIRLFKNEYELKTWINYCSILGIDDDIAIRLKSVQLEVLKVLPQMN